MSARNFPLVVLLLTLIGCNQTPPVYEDQWDMTPNRRDSLRFVREHHYGPNFNFKIIADSLSLVAHYPENDEEQPFPEASDSVMVYANDRLVVADFHTRVPHATDSVWIKVARDQQTMGWLPERQLLKGAVPDDPISYSIHLFSSRHTVWFLWFLCFCMAVLFCRNARRRRPDFTATKGSDLFYPTLLYITVSGTASLYAGIQRYAPEIWQEFYFHPTLNPFGQPFILTAFITAFWLHILLGLAAIDDMHKRMEWNEAIPRLCGMAGLCMVLYVFFTLTCYYYAGYIFLGAYWTFILRRWYRRHCRYRCGACDRPLRDKGVCPYCGALNK